MHSLLRATGLMALIGSSIVTHADPRVTASLGGVADNEQGRSLDADATVSTGSWWGLGGGGGVTRSPSALGMLSGASERALAEAQYESVDLRAYYHHWEASPFENQTVGARSSWTHSGLTLSGIAEWRSLSVGYSDPNAEGAEREARFSGTGFGGGLKYAGAHWSAGVDAIWYSFHSLSRYVSTQTAILGTPTGPALLPILSSSVSRIAPSLTSAVLGAAPSLTSSVVTLNQSALQHLVTADVSRDFGAASVHLDWSNARDAVLQTTINSYSVSYRQTFSEHWNAALTLGTNDSAYGNSTFGGASVGFSL